MVKIKANPAMRVMLEVKLSDIQSLLIDAFEGGSNYWYMITAQTAPRHYFQRTDPDRIYPHADYPVNPGGSLTITTLEKDTIKGATEWTLNLESIRAGLDVIAKRNPKLLADILTENTDSLTADAFLQYCLFGDVIYG